MTENLESPPTTPSFNIEIVEITVGASTGFNHPTERFTNFKPTVELRALVHGGPDVPIDLAVRQLQETAHHMVLEDRARILADIDRRAAIENSDQQIANWAADVARFVKERADLESVISDERLRTSHYEKIGSTAAVVASKDLIQRHEAELTKIEERWKLTELNIANYRAYVAALRRGENPPVPQVMYPDECPF